MSCRTHRHACSGRKCRSLRTPFLIAALWATTCLATQAIAWERCWTVPSFNDAAASGRPHVAPIVWTLPILFLLFIYRRPSGTKSNPWTNSSSAGGIASLSCSRCGRVLELPRDKAARQLFCPRCGSTLPRIR